MASTMAPMLSTASLTYTLPGLSTNARLPPRCSRRPRSPALAYADNLSAIEILRSKKRYFYIDSDPATDLRVLEETQARTWRGKAVDRLLRYFLPEGYPDSVGPDYIGYTRWRLAAFFFGGGVGVFSTQGLLLAVGVGRQSAAPLAAALQWVIRDGLGRAGRMLFSQVGTGFDAETKQYRFAAAFVLNASCALESVTPAVPHLFLPLACIANMAKGASTVAAASTRSAIYRSFMRRENLGEITAKQETVGVLGDLFGTAMGIVLSRLTAHSRRWATIAFMSLSVAHMYSVYREVRGIQLGTLNRQRAHQMIQGYLENHRVPTLGEGNRGERILNRPWLDSLHAPNIDLGARLGDCAPDAEALHYLMRMYRNDRYLFVYEDTRMKIALRSDASSHDCLKAFLQADYFWRRYKVDGVREDRNRELLEESYKFANANFDRFAKEAAAEGWRTNSVLLRPIGRHVAWGPALNKMKYCGADSESNPKHDLRNNSPRTVQLNFSFIRLSEYNPIDCLSLKNGNNTKETDAYWKLQFAQPNTVNFMETS